MLARQNSKDNRMFYRKPRRSDKEKIWSKFVLVVFSIFYNSGIFYIESDKAAIIGF